MIKNQTEFLNVAFKAYDNPKIISVLEFAADVKRFSYLNKSLSAYTTESDEHKLRLAINHVVILINCFGSRSIELLDYKTELNIKMQMFTILYFLKMVETVEHLDFDLLNKLEKL